MRAVAAFTLDSWDPETIDEGPGAALGRVRTTKTSTADLVGTSTVEMLTVAARSTGLRTAATRSRWTTRWRSR